MPRVLLGGLRHHLLQRQVWLPEEDVPRRPCKLQDFELSNYEKITRQDVGWQEMQERVLARPSFGLAEFE